MTRLSFFPSLFVLTVLSLIALGAASDEPAHPSLLFCTEDVPALRAKVSDGWIGLAFGAMKKRADEFLQVPTDPYPMYTRTDAATSGRRLNVRVSTLHLTGLLTGDDKYIHKAVGMAMAAARQTCTADFDEWNGHLSIADGAHAYAMAYDWLWPHLTAEQRSLLRAEVEEFGQWLYDYSATNRHYGSYRQNPLSCNHNAMIHGGLGLCALVLGDHGDWLERAAKFVGGYFEHARDDTGYNYEGLSYYGYGSWCAIPFSVALKRSGGPDLVRAQPKNALITRWILHQMQPWGDTLVPMNDSNHNIANAAGFAHLVAEYQDRVGLWTWLELYGAEGDGSFGRDPRGGLGHGASIPYTLLFADPSLTPQSPTEAKVPTHAVYSGGRASYRTDWGPLAALATFTSGFDPHRGHNHKDENSFTFTARGEMFAIDPAYQCWETRSHNTVLVDGTGQLRDEGEYDCYGKTIDTHDFGEAWSITGSAVDAFPEVLGIGTATRTLLFASGETPYLVVADDIAKASGEAAEYAWLLHTDRKNTIRVDQATHSAVIRGGRRKALCRIEFVYPAEEVAISETDLTGQTFPGPRKDGRIFPYARFFKELRAVTRTTNARFVAILTAADTEEEMPRITCTGTPDDMKIQVASKAGYTDRIAITGTKMRFTRERAVNPR